jgi:RNA polymerase sigma factor (sigma-70 family)
VRDEPGIGGDHNRFPSTRTSLFEAAASSLPNLATEQLIALYWKPVYRFIRIKFRKDNEDAKDLTQSFFATALQRDFFKRFDPDKASFRTYLRMAVERFAANQHEAAGREKRGGSFPFEPIADQEIAAESPEHAFEREWQRQLFSLAIDDLRAHCDACGKLVQFAIFEAYDLASDNRPSYASLAAQHALAETTVTNYLAWARRMLRGFVNARLQGVTPDEREFHAEMRRLWK